MGAINAVVQLVQAAEAALARARLGGWPDERRKSLVCRRRRGGGGRGAGRRACRGRGGAERAIRRGGGLCTRVPARKFGGGGVPGPAPHQRLSRGGRAGGPVAVRG